jgi:hypothetical protein
MASTQSGDDLHEHLARWVAEGLIDSGQASGIEAAETAHRSGVAAPVVEPVRRGAFVGRVPLVVEALGYLGGALAVIAGLVAVNQFWPDISVAAQLSFAGTAAAVLGLVGAVVRRPGEPALCRLRAVLWLMSTACVAAFVGVLAAQVWRFGPEASTAVAAGTTTGYAVVLWRRASTPLQHLVMFAAAAVTVGSGVAWLGADNWVSGLGVWLLSALWAVAVHRGYLRPRTTGQVAAAVGLLAGGQLTMEVAAGHALALGTVAALLAAGVAGRRVWLLGLGAVGVIMVVPETAVRYLPESVGAPLALLAVGLVLLATAVWLARSRTRPRPR